MNEASLTGTTTVTTIIGRERDSAARLADRSVYTMGAKRFSNTGQKSAEYMTFQADPPQSTLTSML